MKKIIRIAFVLIIVVNLVGERGTLVEELNLPNSIGYDIVEKKIIMYFIIFQLELIF